MSAQLHHRAPSRFRGLATPMVFLLVLVLLALGTGAFVIFNGKKADDGPRGVDTFTVREGGFDIVIPTSGELAALQQVEINNPLETRGTIMWIVDEGVTVKPGDLLVRFNDDDLANKVKDSDDAVNSAANSLENMKANLEIRKKTRESDLAKADLEITLTNIAYQAWEEGEVVSERQKLALDKKTAKMQYDRLLERFEASKRLYEQEFISLDEYKRDEISLVEAEADLAQADLDIEVYNKYTFVQQREEKLSDKQQAIEERERKQQRLDAEVRSAESDLERAEYQVERRKEQLDRWKGQHELCTVNAPGGGLVVYASSIQTGGHGRSQDQDPPMVGTDVAPNKTIMIIPDTSQMIAEVKVNEALTGLIRVGQRATIVSDAHQDIGLAAEVMSVGVLAETGGWRDPNRRDYTVKLLLHDFDRSLGIKPSMRCKADINVGRVNNSNFVPIQSVFRNGPLAYVWIPDGGGYSQRQVAIGRASEMYVEVLEGVTNGDVVLTREPDIKEIVARLDLPDVDASPANHPAAAPAYEAPDATEAPDHNAGASDGEQRRRGEGRRGGGRPTAEQMQEMMKNATPEQRAEWERRMREREGGQGEGQGEGEHSGEEAGS